MTLKFKSRRFCVGIKKKHALGVSALNQIELKKTTEPTEALF